MALSEEQVRHVARLARLALGDDEVERLREELSKILAYAEQVGEVATTDVEPTHHAFPLSNIWRDDEPVDPLSADDAISTAPVPEDGRFRVPRIVSEEA